MAQLVLSVAGNAVGGPVGGFIGSVVGSFIDQALFGPGDQQLADKIGSRLDQLKVQTSGYGKTIPKVYGYMRLGGNVIWAQNIREVENRQTTTQSGGGKGGSPEITQTTVSFSYFATLAIGVCEGTVDEVVGIWADSEKLDGRTIEEADGKYEVHLGAEDQAVSSIIESYEGVGNTPAYRGLTYIVIEDFPLAKYGNRIPNFTVEVKRTVQISPSVEELVKDIVIIPGSGEFAYSTTVTQKYTVDSTISPPVQTGKAEALNMHNFDKTANATLAVSQMLEALPNLEWVAVVVNWFVTSKNMATGTIIPKIEFTEDQGATTPSSWQVGSVTRSAATLVETFPDGTPTYGGTPSDHTVIELCAALKAAGLNVLFYPMPLIDTVNETAGEDDKPWRGRMIPTSASECNTWFTQTNGYNAFIRHYSQLSGLTANIDAFVIGSELVGITGYDSGGNTYPGVTNLVTLAGLVASDIPSIPLTYAADWSEYHSTGGYYNMDPLWTCADIDFVGIDNYMPLTPDLDQSAITQELIKQYWEDGEGWSYYYTDAVARTGLTSYVPDDGTNPFAWKNIEQWWNSAHNNPGPVATGWTAKMKPIWFTEFGFPSVDGAANQSNVFVDPTSSESFYPRGSKERIDFLAQREAINATLEFWQAKNAESGNADLVPRAFLWTWDARPYPFFPDLLDVWADGGNWRTGHWVNGKFGISDLGAIVASLLQEVGFTLSDFDVTELRDPVEGYVINDRGTVRQRLELLRSIYLFDVIESDGIIKFIKRGLEPTLTIVENEIVPEITGEIRKTVDITRKQELDLPRQVDISFINRASGYQSTAQTAQRQVTNAVDKIGINAPIIMSEGEGRSRAEKSLYASWVARNLFEFALPPKYVYVEAGDIITLTINNVNHTVRIVSTQLSRNGSQRVKGLSDDITAYDFYIQPNESPNNPQQGLLTSPTNLELMDLPKLPTDTGEAGDLRIAVNGFGEGWTGTVLYRSDDGGENGGNTFNALETIQSEAVTGTLLNAIPAGPRNNWDYANYIDIAILQGSLSSVTKLAVYNGANVMLVGNEIIQFQTATLITAGKYRLTNLLRGRLGTEHEMGTQSQGDSCVLLDSAVIKLSVAVNSFDLLKYYKAVTIGEVLADTTEETFVYTGKKFRPYSPVKIEGTRDVSSNLTITWVRRSRIDADWRDKVDVALGEESELYEVDIMNGVNVVRTITTTTPTASYTAAEQTTDFGSSQSSLSVKIYQISAIFGRGVAGEATI